ncbi:MAG: hypothetical protein Q4C95_01750 [Planctomycetia bacterium]|nr:hypothetical protein [Planctomycetia bacterium]
MKNSPAETFISALSPFCFVIENDVPFYAFGAINPDVNGTHSPNRCFIDNELIGTVLSFLMEKSE